MPAIEHNLPTMNVLSLSPREERVGREPERGVRWQNYAPPLPGPLLRFAEEREKITMRFVLERITTNEIFLSTTPRMPSGLNPQPTTH